MGLIILRCVFVLVAAGLSVTFIQTDPGIYSRRFGMDVMGDIRGDDGSRLGRILAWIYSVRKKKLDTITAVYFGMIVGLFMTYVLSLALVPFWQYLP